jgi:hypothetical protein
MGLSAERSSKFRINAISRTKKPLKKTRALLIEQAQQQMMHVFFGDVPHILWFGHLGGVCIRAPRALSKPLLAENAPMGWAP